jgi:minor histocompatibility antigen H13
MNEVARAKQAAMYASEKPAIVAHAALLLLSALPLIMNVPTNLNVVATASLAVYCGSWRSIKIEPITESMSGKDALKFPLIGSCVLFGLFLLFKFIPARIVNALLSLYLGSIAVFVLTACITPYVQDVFPETIRKKEFKAPPFQIPCVLDATKENQLTATIPQIFVGLVSLGFCGWYYFTKFWFSNNILGLAFCLEGIEHFSLGSVQTGTILLVGLFFYDIFWVFCTPVMVSVAKNFDAPIKLLFPRALDALGKRPFSMLGLGDIVIPGFFVALMLRYDLQNGFRTKYFQSCFGGYVLGLTATLAVMIYFNSAQPALLYIVPSVLGCTGIHAWTQGEFKKVFEHSETVTLVEEPKTALESKKSQ